MPVSPRSLPRHCLMALAALTLLAAGCNVLSDRGDDSPLRPVSADGRDVAPSAVPEPVRGWAVGQRHMFERAWREIRADLSYESIDSFRDLDAEARRDVQAMRRELEMAREGAAAVRPARD